MSRRRMRVAGAAVLAVAAILLLAAYTRPLSLGTHMAEADGIHEITQILLMEPSTLSAMVPEDDAALAGLAQWLQGLEIRRFIEFRRLVKPGRSSVRKVHSAGNPGRMVTVFGNESSFILNFFQYKGDIYVETVGRYQVYRVPAIESLEALDGRLLGKMTAYK